MATSEPPSGNKLRLMCIWGFDNRCIRGSWKGRNYSGLGLVSNHEIYGFAFWLKIRVQTFPSWTKCRDKEHIYLSNSKQSTRLSERNSLETNLILLRIEKKHLIRE